MMNTLPFKTRVLVQARLTSERLPGKVLEKIGGLAVIEHIAGRIASLDNEQVELVFAIADEKSPTTDGGVSPLAEFLRERDLKFFQGDTMHVLKRYVDASADLHENDYVVRLTGDNPFVDQMQLARLLDMLAITPVDYAHTADLPLGMGSEAIRVAALRSVMLRDVPPTLGGVSGLAPHHREHVTTFIRENPHLYEIVSLRLDETISPEAARERIAKIRLTVDEPSDLDVARGVYEYFLRRGLPYFTAQDAIAVAKNDPALFAGNLGVVQKSPTSYQGMR